MTCQVLHRVGANFLKYLILLACVYKPAFVKHLLITTVTRSE